MQILLEHDSTPGAYYENHLIYDGGMTLNEMQIIESVNEAAAATAKIAVPLVRFRGKLQEANAVNKNKRMYPKNVLDECVKKLQEALESGGLIGELDHPTDSIIHFRDASHRITKLWWEDNVLMGEGEILNTPYGKLLKSLMESGIRVGMSSRGVGNGRVNEDGILVIGESYKLITFDAVADPSTYAAFQEKIVGNSKKESFSEKSELRNESSGIYKVNKNLLLACFGAIVKKETGKIKRGLNG